MLKQDSGDDYDVMFHSSRGRSIDADNFQYRPVEIQGKGSYGQGPGVFTHGYDQDYDDVFGDNVYAVVYNKNKPTYSGKMDTTSGIDETFIPQSSVGEMVKIWGQGKPVQFNTGGSVMANKNSTKPSSDKWWKDIERAIKDHTTYGVPGVGGEVSLNKGGIQYDRAGPLGSQFDFSVSPNNVGANLQWSFNDGGPVNPTEWAGEVMNRLNTGGTVVPQLLPQVAENLLNGYNEGGSTSPYKGLKKGAFTADASSRGMTPAQFQAKVLSNPSEYSEVIRKRAQC